MVIHERLHTGEKPYACMYGCGRSYKWLSSINFHQARCSHKAPNPPQRLPVAQRGPSVFMGQAIRRAGGAPNVSFSRDVSDASGDFAYSPSSRGPGRLASAGIAPEPAARAATFSQTCRRPVTLYSTAKVAAAPAAAPVAGNAKRSRKRKRVAPEEGAVFAERGSDGKRDCVARDDHQELPKVPLSPLSPNSSSSKASEKFELLTRPFCAYTTEGSSRDSDGLHDVCLAGNLLSAGTGDFPAVSMVTGVPLSADPRCYGPLRPYKKHAPSSDLPANSDRKACVRKCEPLLALPCTNALPSDRDMIKHPMAPFSPVTPERPGLPSEKMGPLFDDFALAVSAVDLFPVSDMLPLRGLGGDRDDLLTLESTRALVGIDADFEAEAFGLLPF
jgi:hypothetical protein